LRSDVVLLQHRDAQVEAAGLSTNAYAVLEPHGAVLVDAVFADTLPDAARLATWGVLPVVVAAGRAGRAGGTGALASGYIVLQDSVLADTTTDEPMSP
jgi:hypothetical protein